MTLPRWFTPAFFAVAVAAALWRAPQPPAPAFAVPFPAAVSTLAAEFASEALPIAGASAHAATLAELPDGRLAAAWFAGSREGAADVAVWFSIRESSGWSPPRAIATRTGTGASTLTHVRKLGNPVLFRQDDRLHLWYVSASLGGWAGSSINHTVSGDGGLTWSPATRLVTSPFFNISTLVRTPPLPLADGGLGLPIYHEFIGKHGEWLRFGPDGRILGKVRMAQDRAALQPAAAVAGPHEALALLRDAGPGDGHVLMAATEDGGATWQTRPPLPIHNPNASLALLRLASGRLLLAANPVNGRHILQLFISADGGKTWQGSKTIENSADTGAEFSYPALLQDRAGRIHLAYTWQRQGIRHAAFSEAWLQGGPP